jgi:hypothetical protein
MRFLPEDAVNTSLLASPLTESPPAKSEVVDYSWYGMQEFLGGLMRG